MNISQLPWKKIDAFIALLLCSAWVGLSVLFSYLNIKSVDTGLYVTIVFNFFVVATALFIFSVVRKGNLKDFGFKRFSESHLDLGCALFLASYAFNFFYGIILNYFAPELPTQSLEFLDLLNSVSYPWLFILLGSFIIPITEEIFFRGFLFSSLHKFMDFKFAAVLSSLIFASLHFFVSAFLPIFVLSLVLTYIFKKSGSLWLNITLHMILNTSSLLLLWFINSNIGV